MKKGRGGGGGRGGVTGCSKQLTHLCHADSWVAGTDIEMLNHFIHLTLAFPNLQAPPMQYIVSKM